MSSPERLVLVHGFTQTGRSWDPVVAALRGAGLTADTTEIVAPDVPDGPGLADVATTLAARCGPAGWWGYSRGGRIALHAAPAHPDAVARLVVVGPPGGIDDPVDRAPRRETDEGWAAMAERVGVRR